MVIDTMVLQTLRARLSALLGSNATDRESAREAQAGAKTNGQHDGEETLSYAEQVEYGASDREIADEDKVLRLLVKRGGRVDETTILEETGWKESHLSAVVEEMEDDNQVSAITVGRKRVICRRGFEPKGYRSHLNE